MAPRVISGVLGPFSQILVLSLATTALACPEIADLAQTAFTPGTTYVMADMEGPKRRLLVKALAAQQTPCHWVLDRRDLSPEVPNEYDTTVTQVVQGRDDFSFRSGAQLRLTGVRDIYALERVITLTILAAIPAPTGNTN